MNIEARVAIGIDLGGTNVVAGLVQEDGQVLASERERTRPERGESAVIETLASLVQRVAGDRKPAAVGIGCPGFIDPLRGVVLLASNLAWTNVPLAAKLEARAGLPVVLDNDVRMFTFAEAKAGAGQGYPVVLGLTLGTGMSAALVHQGAIYRGGGFLAGEVGHIPIPGIPYRCSCGLTGCLETIASATGIARLARETVQAGTPTVLASMHERAELLTAADVSQAYAEGDPAAASILGQVGRTLGEALSYLTPMLSPDAIVIGGGAAQAGEPLFAPLRRTLRERLLPMYGDRVAVVQAKHLDHAGVIGSAMYALSQRSKE
ncbi:ROK family protein [Paenibacillus chartarius]|uniref:ROK family protein n=1 Tax=Paenibacillus chartarius TaxID=747481 RepID=A0ABV6DH76_9BACL